MDVYGSDRKLSELGDNDFHDILDHDVFNTPCTGSMEYSMDSDWLDNFFDDPVLNDRMMSDALQPPNVQSEHSYSMTNSDQECDSPLNLTKDPTDKELETEFIATSCTSTPVTTTGLAQTTLIKQEPMDTELQSCTQMNTSTPCTTAQTVLKQPTIILATTTQTTPLTQTLRQERLVLPKVNIKLEPTENVSYSSDPGVLESMTLPPTPPSSTNSDSEGSQSPQRSAPASPSRDHIHMRSQTSHYTQNQPLFTSPIPQSGVLILSEEEKRTLISEGYPIPGKLPLTKQEEKNLKKIRRKIKNKISAQESRRKKKEYLDTLEKRVESFSQENTDLKKKIDQLENSNRSLLSQLQRLQNLVSKVPRPSSATSTQTGTCLMVLVLCFAVFMGGWSPASFSIGYSKTVSSPAKNSVVDRVYIGPEPMGPQVKDARVDAYATPNMRSRVLLSIKEDGEDDYGPHTPFSYRDMFTKLFRGIVEDTSAADSVVMDPPLPQAQVMAQAIDADQQSQSEKVIQASIPIDLAANLTAKVMTGVDKNRNTTA